MVSALKTYALGERVEASIDRRVSIELVRVTEAAARAAYKHLGRGDKNALDGAAVDAMRRALGGIDLYGTVVIGEGEKDNAPMLYNGEVLGTPNGTPVDIAVDPVDGTTLASKGLDNALSVIAIGEKGKLLQAPDMSMQKLAFGAGIDSTQFNLDMGADAVVKEYARQRAMPVEDVVVCLLERPRHAHHLEAIRRVGARTKLISDGDIAGALAAALPESGVDIYLGSGGAPEGVLAAAALKCLGGSFMGRLDVQSSRDSEKAQRDMQAMGLSAETVYTLEDLAGGEVIFAATGITDGSFLKGVRHVRGGEMTHTIVMRSHTGTVRRVETFHQER